MKEDVWTRRRRGMDEEWRVDPMDQHQHGVSEDETWAETRSMGRCLLLRDGGVDGGKRGHSGDDLQSSLVPNIAVVVVLQGDTRELQDS